MLSVLRRTPAVGWILPVKVKAVKATLAQEGDGLRDEGFPVARRPHDLGKRGGAEVPASDRQHGLHVRVLLLQVHKLLVPVETGSDTSKKTTLTTDC